MISSRKEIKDNVLSTTRQANAQIGSLVNEFINLTISEINNPGWAFPRSNYNHLWNFLKRKTTFTTTASTSDYVLAREIDKIALIRQTNTPIKLTQVPDEKFFELIPNPTETGNPKWYRIWEHEGVATRLAAADTIDVVSSSGSDAGSAELLVSVSGFSSGIWTTETYQLNGTTKVSGTVSFDAREIFVSKQKDTTGTITVTENSGSTTLTTLGPDERAARFKVVTLYPTPSSAITMHVEFYTRIPSIENDADTPGFNRRWHYIVRLGSLAKVYQYLNKETDFTTTQALYASAVRSMVDADRNKPDLIEHLSPRLNRFPQVRLHRSEDAIA